MKAMMRVLLMSAMGLERLSGLLVLVASSIASAN